MLLEQTGNQALIMHPPFWPAGVTSTIALFPLETVRTRIAVHHGAYTGIGDCLKQTVAKEGFKGLYQVRLCICIMSLLVMGAFGSFYFHSHPPGKCLPIPKFDVAMRPFDCKLSVQEFAVTLQLVCSKARSQPATLEVCIVWTSRSHISSKPR